MTYSGTHGERGDEVSEEDHGHSCRYRRRYTYADLEELPDDDRIYDIVGGELLVGVDSTRQASPIRTE